MTVLNIPDKNSPRALGGDPKSDKEMAEKVSQAMKVYD